MNIQTIIVLAIVLVAVYFAIKHVKKTKGCDCSVGADCSSCHGSCHHE